MDTISNRNRVRATLKETQNKLSTPSRIVSKIVHSSIIDNTLTCLETTLLRPVPLLWAISVSGLMTFLHLLLEAYFGYKTSGSEFYIGSIAGWAIGFAYEIATKNKLRIR